MNKNKQETLPQTPRAENAKQRARQASDPTASAEEGARPGCGQERVPVPTTGCLGSQALSLVQV